MFKLIVVLSLLACVAFAAHIPRGLLPQLDGRIVGGENASIKDINYIVSIQRNGFHFCGGSIYNKRTIISAAHCFQGTVHVSALQIRVGSDFPYEGGITRKVRKVKSHRGFVSSTMVNDVAVLHLKTPLDLSSFSDIKSVKLATGAPAHNTPALVAGWGRTSSGGLSPQRLLSVNVNIVSLDACQSSTYSYGSQVKKSMICAFAIGKDSCQGDSGGPLVVDKELVGIVSWGYGCAQSQYPGVYSDVAELRKWIIANAK